MNTELPIDVRSPRTDAEIVRQTNELARICLSHLGTGYIVAEGHKFYESEDPRSQSAWNRACEIMEFMTQTDANDALTSMGEVRTYSVRIRVTGRLYAEDTVEATSIEEACAMAGALDPSTYRFTYEKGDGFDGDEIAYVREADDEEAHEHEVDLRRSGEPFSWDACQIVKDLALAVEDGTDLNSIAARAVAACQKPDPEETAA